MTDMLDLALAGAAAAVDANVRPWLIGAAHLRGVPPEQEGFGPERIRSVLHTATATVQFPSGAVGFLPAGYDMRTEDQYELITLGSDTAPHLELKIGLGIAGVVAVGFTRGDVFDDGVARPGGVLLTDAEAVVADAYVLALASALELGYFGPIDVVFEVAHERPGVPLTYDTLDDETGDLLEVTNTRTTPGPLYGHTEFTRDTTPQDVNRDIHAMASELVGRFGLATQLVDLLPPDAPDYEGDPLDMIRRT